MMDGEDDARAFTLPITYWGTEAGTPGDIAAQNQ